MGHGARGKIREKINSKKQAQGGIFLVNECSFVLYGKLTASRSSSPFLVELDICIHACRLYNDNFFDLNIYDNQ